MIGRLYQQNPTSCSCYATLSHPSIASSDHCLGGRLLPNQKPHDHCWREIHHHTLHRWQQQNHKLDPGCPAEVQLPPHLDDHRRYRHPSRAPGLPQQDRPAFPQLCGRKQKWLLPAQHYGQPGRHQFSNRTYRCYADSEHHTCRHVGHPIDSGQETNYLMSDTNLILALPAPIQSLTNAPKALNGDGLFYQLKQSFLIKRVFQDSEFYTDACSGIRQSVKNTQEIRKNKNQSVEILNLNIFSIANSYYEKLNKVGVAMYKDSPSEKNVQIRTQLSELNSSFGMLLILANSRENSTTQYRQMLQQGNAQISRISSMQNSLLAFHQYQAETEKTIKEFEFQFFYWKGEVQKKEQSGLKNGELYKLKRQAQAIENKLAEAGTSAQSMQKLKEMLEQTLESERKVYSQCERQQQLKALRIRGINLKTAEVCGHIAEYIGNTSKPIKQDQQLKTTELTKEEQNIQSLLRQMGDDALKLKELQIKLLEQVEKEKKLAEQTKALAACELQAETIKRESSHCPKGRAIDSQTWEIIRIRSQQLTQFF